MQPPTPQSDLPPPPPVVYSAAPPTHPVWFHTPAPAKWPLVVGIISLVYAALNLASYAMGLVFWLLFRGGRMPTMPNSGAMNLFTGPHAWLEVVTYAGGLLAFALLVFAGIATIRRKPSGRPIHLLYAALYLAVLIVTTTAALLGINPALARSPSTFVPTGNFMIAGALLGFVIGGAHPIFTLCWFLPRRHTPQPLPPANPGWVAANGQWLPERPRA